MMFGPSAQAVGPNTFEEWPKRARHTVFAVWFCLGHRVQSEFCSAQRGVMQDFYRGGA